MSCLKYVVIFLIIFECVLCRKPKTKIPCFINNVTGICRRIYECPYAVTLVNQEQRKPPTCGYDDDTKIVCCPSHNLMHTTGVFQKYFKATHDGVIAASNVTCRYEGKQPFLCCKNQPQIPDPDEPAGCKTQAPPLLEPVLNNTPMEKFLWDKCVKYQRYVYKCVNDEDNPEKFTRQNTCGIPTTKNKFRIFGATEKALPRQFPHMAVVGCQDPKNDADIKWVGGGSLISEHFILTAAHVIWSADYGRIYYALLGTLNKKSHDSLLVNVISTIPHKFYEMNGETKMYDIALLRLHERVKFNEFIRPICLPVSDRKINDQRIVAGWGQINSHGDTSDELLYVEIPEQDYTSSCKRRFGDIFDPKTMICAHGTEDKVKDSCKGDSGGPLMAQMTNILCSYSIEGIVSFGTDNCGGNVGVYTRVTAYLDWIVEHVWPDEWMKFNTKI